MDAWSELLFRLRITFWVQVEKLVKPTLKIMQSTSSFFKLGNGGLFVLFFMLDALERLNKRNCMFILF